VPIFHYSYQAALINKLQFQSTLPFSIVNCSNAHSYNFSVFINAATTKTKAEVQCVGSLSPTIMWSLCLFIRSFLCAPDNSKSYERIGVKFSL